MQPSNAEILDAIFALAMKLDDQKEVLDSLETRIASLEGNVKSLDACVQGLISVLHSHGQHIGNILRATPIPVGDCG